MPTYRAVAYRQSRIESAPWLVSFVVTSEELLQWAGIPRRAEGDLIGFQRAADDKRVAKAKAFFQSPENQSPTSLIVGLHPRASNSGLLTLAFDDAVTPEISSINCTISVSDDLAGLTSAQAVDAVRSQVEARLAIEPHGIDDESLTEVSDDDLVDDAEQDGVQDDLSEADEDDEVELGTSVLRRLVERLDDAEWVTAHLDDLRELAKPATIIDGQHRVLGAAAVERSIPFSVTAIVDCPWAEQVFQFTVVNYTAKGIPDQFITANAALSLTGQELDLLQDRLIQAGVKVTEYELMRVVHFDSRSPFFELVNLSEKSNPGLIGYRTMVRIAKTWYDARDPVFQLLLPNLYPDIKGKSPAARRQRLSRWKSDDWGEFFLAFWKVVHDRYATEASHVDGETLWTVGSSQLIVAIVLFMLQQAYIENLGSQDEEFFETNTDDPAKASDILLTKVQRRAEKFLDSIPAAFFKTKWGWTSLSTGPGRSALEQAFQQLVKTKGKYQYVKSALVTGKADANS
jgi:hypothetical protein